MFIDGDDQALAAVDEPGLHKAGGFWFYLDNHVGGLDVEALGAGDIGGKEGGFFSCGRTGGV